MGDAVETMPDVALKGEPVPSPMPEEHVVDIHKPKPVHSWREFLSEIGTIICGILIALTLEQIVSDMEWHRKVADARDAVGLELAENLGRMENRMLLERCLNQRLDAVAGIVDRAEQTGRLPPLPKLHNPPITTWGNGVWNSVVSAQTASHFPADQLRHYGRFYALLDRIAAAEIQEEAAWTTLYELSGPGRSFNDDDARLYRRAIGQAREQNAVITGFGVRGRQVVDAHHMLFDRRVFADRVATAKGNISDCGAPTGVPPTAYGAAPSDGFSAFARAHPSPSDK